jgi:hypothetical protein
MTLGMMLAAGAMAVTHLIKLFQPLIAKFALDPERCWPLACFCLLKLCLGFLSVSRGRLCGIVLYHL